MNKKEQKRADNTKPCDNCKKPFYKSPAHRARFKYNFCSRKCNAEFHTGENHKKYDKDLHIKECLVCKSKVTRARSKFCSPQCQGINARGEKSVRYNKEKINCSECNIEILKHPSIIFKTNFCSKICQNKYHSKRISKENNPRFKDGVWFGIIGSKGIYEGFTLKLKTEIRARDNYKCKVCGMNEETHKMKMHIHHIDYNKKNNNPNNLICVCRYCHGKIHGNEIEWQKILSKV
jgi:hypothetical protein